MNLELVPTQALVDELGKRADTMIYGSITRRPEPDCPEQQIRSIRWKGDAHICAGLGTAISVAAMQGYARDETHIHPDEL